MNAARHIGRDVGLRLNFKGVVWLGGLLFSLAVWAATIPPLLRILL